MTSDIHLAFAHPSERAAATQSGDPLDRISVRDHVIEVEIGAFQAERGTTQRVRFDVVVEVRPLEGPILDDVDRILSYDKVTEAIATELAAERLNLLETLAERVADRILLEPQAMRTFVRIEKLDRGPFALGVEIVRSRPLHVVEDVETAVHPRVVFLSNAAVHSDHLPRWIDQLAADETPVILCVGPSQTPAPQTQVQAAQRRIDLLAIEQNAWVLAGRDKRCVVVGTMTELDWSMKNGQIAVWAPSKIVLDAVDGPSAQPSDTMALVAWFAGHIDASGLLCIGTQPGQAMEFHTVYHDGQSATL
ncbi:dihydroneopterin aldolase [Nereida sp. MMG025]|uniref:dihydroneopterin aldolase n=1 Tax=Nereida sp. MMG025 TaxID=2909981 RepID=UPI001F00B851|nr:dihydroneopterin aldolase [Nereida sp. MMG025]MCF6443788.1 dihydroneopterin aldolase [Nereida sp. MMG025]